MTKLSACLSILFILAIACSSRCAVAQSAPVPAGADTLRNEILQMDSLLFEVAFNECKLAVWEEIMGQDFEFYDDRTGLNTDRQVEINAFHDRCSKPYTLTRQLIRTEVHALGKYGAVQLGEHSFRMDGKPVEHASFVIVWEKKAGRWLVKRVISYDHQPLE